MTANAVSNLSQLIGLIGGMGNAAGIKGDGPTGLNALQRAALPPEQSSALSQLNARQGTNLISPAITQMYQQGNITGQDALTALANPMTPLGASPALSPSAPPSTPNPGSNLPTQPIATIPSGINYDLINQDPRPLIREMATSIVNGTFNPESGKGENDPSFNAALDLANRADATLKGNYLSRAAMTKNITSGDMYKLSTNMNAAAAHLYDLHEEAPLTRNMPDSGQPVNWIGQLETKLLGGQPANDISRYEGVVTQASPEIAKYLSGATGTNVGTAEAARPFDSTLAPNAIQANAKDMFGRMMAKGGVLQQEYDTALGNAKNRSVVQPLTAALYKDMQGQPLTLQEQQLVNAHRAESNLPPKTWGMKQTTGKPVNPVLPPSANSQPPQLPPLPPEVARAELARRVALRKKP